MSVLRASTSHETIYYGGVRSSFYHNNVGIFGYDTTIIVTKFLPLLFWTSRAFSNHRIIMLQ